MSAKPWVKVWRPRPGSAFESRLSAPARVLFRGLLPYLDDNGEIALPARKDCYQALGCGLGYTKNERRSLRVPVADLLTHGCLVATQDDDGYWRLSAPKWGQFQRDGKITAGTSRVRPEYDLSTTLVRGEYESGTSRVRGEGHEITPKCAESPDLKIQEERRGEETKRRGENTAREDTPVSRWRFFWSAWCSRFADYGEPMLDAFPMARTLSKIPDRGAFEAEVTAYVETIATDDFRPAAPHRHFAKSVGDWTRQAKQAKKPRKGAKVVNCSPASAFDEPELDDIFGGPPPASLRTLAAVMDEK